MMNRLTGALDFQTQALVLRSERQRVIASNIANADTPGFVARDFDFAGALREATGGGGLTGQGPVMPATDLASGRYTPTLRFATAAQPNLDRNTVDMDRERASFADNTVKYEAALRFINGSVRTMLEAMRGANQG